MLQSCKTSSEQEVIANFQLSTFHFSISDSSTRSFIRDYITLPENINRKIFTIFFDQNLDTLALTIWRYPYRYVSLKDVLGYFHFEDRVILLYSPFTDLMQSNKNLEFEKEINELYKAELAYYQSHKHELIMWQLKYSYYGKSYKIMKDYKKITYTLKPEIIPDSIEIDIQWPAD